MASKAEDDLEITLSSSYKKVAVIKERVTSKTKNKGKEDKDCSTEKSIALK